MNKVMELDYSTNELINLMLKNEGIHEGSWVLAVKFGFTAMNIRSSDDALEVTPSGIVSVQKVGLQRVTEPLPFSVDAAVVNPVQRKRPKPKVR